MAPITAAVVVVMAELALFALFGVLVAHSHQQTQVTCDGTFYSY
jgi:hypothetical protein